MTKINRESKNYRLDPLVLAVIKEAARITGKTNTGIIEQSVIAVARSVTATSDPDWSYLADARKAGKDLAAALMKRKPTLMERPSPSEN